MFSKSLSWRLGVGSLGYTRVGETFSTEGHIENFIATGGRIYYICNRFKDFNKKFLNFLAQNKGSF